MNSADGAHNRASSPSTVRISSEMDVAMTSVEGLVLRSNAIRLVTIALAVVLGDNRAISFVLGKFSRFHGDFRLV